MAVACSKLSASVCLRSVFLCLLTTTAVVKGRTQELSQAVVQENPPSPFNVAPNNSGAWPHSQSTLSLSTDEGQSSAYIPIDSWIYGSMLRLYSLGFADRAFLTIRPWTRLSALHIVEDSQQTVVESDNEEAKRIVAALLRELGRSTETKSGAYLGPASIYLRAAGIGGNPLRDSWHLGQTIANDYGRPYQTGFNSIVGVSEVIERGRFSFYFRGEYQHAPAGQGYSQQLSSELSKIDVIPYVGGNLHQDTIPTGPIAADNPFRIVEATASIHLLGLEISAGKSDAWLGPGESGSFAWSNNAENIYSLRVNRVEPLRIPLLSRLTGPVRYDFFYGSLKGHTAPNSPYVHSEMFSFMPTRNFQFGFQRTVIFGGKGHQPVTLHTFLKGFFSTSDVSVAEKFSAADPGARFSTFTFSYRIPFIRNYLTLYADSTTHDDVTPLSAPRRAGWLSGLYLSQIPGLRALDIRAEAVYTDYPTTRSQSGQGNYAEGVQLQGYTNKGYIMGHWIGREAKGGQVWMTYHLSGSDYVRLSYLNKKTPKDFLPGGTTQNQFRIEITKSLSQSLWLSGSYQVERWKAPIYEPGLHTNQIGFVQVTYRPYLHVLETK